MFLLLLLMLTKKHFWEGEDLSFVLKLMKIAFHYGGSNNPRKVSLPLKKKIHGLPAFIETIS